MGKRKEEKLTVEAGQPGVQTHAGFRTCVIHQNSVKIRKSLSAVLSRKKDAARDYRGGR